MRFYSQIWYIPFGRLLWKFLSDGNILYHTAAAAAAAAKSLQSCPTLCDPIDGSPPGSPVPGILQARTLERVAISFSSAWKWKVKVKTLSHVWLLATPWTEAYQALPSIGFSRQEYWSGVPLLSLLTAREGPLLYDSKVLVLWLKADVQKADLLGLNFSSTTYWPWSRYLIWGSIFFIN